MHAARNWHLRQLLVLLAAIALLPVLLASGWAIQSTVTQHRSEVERSALDLTRALATAVGTELESTTASLRMLSQSQTLADGDLPGFYQAALHMQQAYPAWQSVILSSADGRLLFSTARPYGDMTAGIVDPESLRQTVESGRAVVGSAMVGPRGNFAFPVRVPVHRGTSIPYVLSAAVVPERILEILRQQKVPEQWVVTVLDASGKRVARTKDHVSRAPSPSLTALLSTGKTEDVGVTTTLEGKEAITAFTRVHGHSWTVAVGIPTSEIGGPLLRGAFFYLAGVVISLLAWGMASSWLSSQIIAAVNQLRQRATKLVREGKVLSPARSRIAEINEADAALVALSRERAEVESERERLLASLNTALDASRLALSQAEEAGHAKDNFLAMLGHELRNPLAPIVSAIDLMDLRGNESNAKERAILRRQVDHLHRLVDDLLDVSRIVQGKLHIRMEQMDLRQAGFRAHEAVAHAAGAAGTRLEIDLPDSPVTIQGDLERMVQAVTNLLTNAIRFTAGGTVRLALACEDGNAILVVEDNGAGMDEPTLAKLFQPFFQAPQSLARSQGGLGLGLTIVKTIVKLHGGHLRVSSGGIGTGSRFDIRLPLVSPAEPATREQAPETLHAAEGRRILVVDDNVDAAKLLAEGLVATSHQVRTAYRATEALALLSSFRPEIAILDIGMPEVDGYQLARAIRTQDSSRTCRLIALSGYGQAQDKEQARAAGFDHHLTKPARLGELNRVISML